MLKGEYYGKWLPTVIFGSVALLASLLTLLLPETVNRRLPDTVEDIEHPKKQENANHDFDNIAMEKDTNVDGIQQID